MSLPEHSLSTLWRCSAITFTPTFLARCGLFIRASAFSIFRQAFKPLFFDQAVYCFRIEGNEGFFITMVVIVRAGGELVCDDEYCSDLGWHDSGLMAGTVIVYLAVTNSQYI